MGSRTRSLFDTVNVAQLPGLHLSAAEIDSIIVTHGSSGELRRAVLCPCMRLDTRTPALDCPHCKGLGRLYPAHLREPLIFLDSQRSQQLKLAAAGHVPSGTISITMPSGVVAGMGDMILPDGDEHVVTEILWVQGSNRVTDRNLRPLRISPDQVKPSLTTRTERLLYPDPCCVEAISYLRDGEIVFAQPIEYRIDNEGRVHWTADNGPEPGTAFTARYRAPAVYVVHTTSPRLRHEANERMPYAVSAVRLDKFAASDLRE